MWTGNKTAFFFFKVCVRNLSDMDTQILEAMKRLKALASAFLSSSSVCVINLYHRCVVLNAADVPQG